jgi:hypothetical protein
MALRPPSGGAVTVAVASSASSSVASAPDRTDGSIWDRPAMLTVPPFAAADAVAPPSAVTAARQCAMTGPAVGMAGEAAEKLPLPPAAAAAVWTAEASDSARWWRWGADVSAPAAIHLMACLQTRKYRTLERGLGSKKRGRSRQQNEDLTGG